MQEVSVTIFQPSYHGIYSPFAFFANYFIVCAVTFSNLKLWHTARRLVRGRGGGGSVTKMFRNFML